MKQEIKIIDFLRFLYTVDHFNNISVYGNQFSLTQNVIDSNDYTLTLPANTEKNSKGETVNYFKVFLDTNVSNTISISLMVTQEAELDFEYYFIPYKNGTYYTNGGFYDNPFVISQDGTTCETDLSYSSYKKMDTTKTDVDASVDFNGNDNLSCVPSIFSGQFADSLMFASSSANNSEKEIIYKCILKQSESNKTIDIDVLQRSLYNFSLILSSDNKSDIYYHSYNSIFLQIGNTDKTYIFNILRQNPNSTVALIDIYNTFINAYLDNSGTVLTINCTNGSTSINGVFSILEKNASGEILTKRYIHINRNPK